MSAMTIVTVKAVNKRDGWTKGHAVGCPRVDSVAVLRSYPKASIAVQYRQLSRKLSGSIAKPFKGEDV